MDGYREIIQTGLVKVDGKLVEVKLLVDPKNAKGALDSLARIYGRFNDNINVNLKNFEQLVLRKKVEGK